MFGGLGVNKALDVVLGTFQILSLHYNKYNIFKRCSRNHKREPKKCLILIKKSYRIIDISIILRYMYISFVLGLIANAKQRKHLVEYRL